MRRALDRLAAARPDVLVVAAYGLLLPPAVLDLAPHGALNIHASLLPRWRGAAPIQRALLAGDAKPGSHHADGRGAGHRAGAGAARLAIAPDDDAQTCTTSSPRSAPRRSLRRSPTSRRPGEPAPQAERARPTRARSTTDEAELDWPGPLSKSSARCAHCDPRPAPGRSLRGAAVKVWRARCVARGDAGRRAGGGAEGVLVACGEGALRVTELQRAGGKRLAAAEFLRGCPIAAASALAPLAEALAAAAARVARVAAGRSLRRTGARRAAIAASRAPRWPIYATARCGATAGRRRSSRRCRAAQGRRPLVEALLWCALYALESGRYAEYTVVDQAVRACVRAAAQRRQGLRERAAAQLPARARALEARIGADAGALRHPRGGSTRARAYPEDWEQVLAAGNTHPPMCLRVNAGARRRRRLRARLAAEGIAARRVGAAALLLERPVPVERLPGFAAGEVSVQDAGAQRAAACWICAPGQRVLDACAAPGGKSAHILETAEVDADRARRGCGACARIEARSRAARPRGAGARCGLHRTGAWWDGGAFDRILADVPCTASGVARRHPDIKWLRRAADCRPSPRARRDPRRALAGARPGW